MPNSLRSDKAKFYEFCRKRTKLVKPDKSPSLGLQALTLQYFIARKITMQMVFIIFVRIRQEQRQCNGVFF